MALIETERRLHAMESERTLFTAPFGVNDAGGILQGHLDYAKSSCSAEK
ncbi:hypothetical protein [Sulfurimicrobium lacus]|nr:hypothetical protein [Sulfurimicrobium lacus]